jgi:hypothetical protein
MGYILTSAVSPDAILIEACARYITGEGDGGPMQAISNMTATTPEGWRALAAAADHAAELDNAGHAAELIFVMQRSLLGKRKRIREQPPRVGEPANTNQPLAFNVALNTKNEPAMHEHTIAEIAESWCIDKPSTAPAMTETLSGLAASGLATSGLAAKIQMRQAIAQEIYGDWRPASAYRNAMASLIPPDAGRVFVTA